MDFDKIELTILMPCLNEEKTIGQCIKEAQAYLEETGCRGEILISDNGSVDSSVQIAEASGARVVHCEKKGYGNALRCGFRHAEGTFVIFADSDMSYDFYNLGEIHEKLRNGCDLVVGNRFVTPPVREAMSFSHRLGVPLLSLLGRLRYHCDVRDFHCGLRGFRKEALDSLDLKAEGMEFATEMIGKASLAGLKIEQVPVVLRPDGRGGSSHLRTVRDGWRHIRWMLFE